MDHSAAGGVHRVCGYCKAFPEQGVGLKKKKKTVAKLKTAWAFPFIFYVFQTS